MILSQESQHGLSKRKMLQNISIEEYGVENTKNLQSEKLEYRLTGNQNVQEEPPVFNVYKIHSMINNKLSIWLILIIVLSALSNVELIVVEATTSLLPARTANSEDSDTLLRLQKQQQQQQLFAMLTRNGDLMTNFHSPKRSYSPLMSPYSAPSNERVIKPIAKDPRSLKSNHRKKNISSFKIETMGFIADEAAKQLDETSNVSFQQAKAKSQQNASQNGNMCPTECQCLNSFFDCVKRQLSYVPYLPSYVEHLDLTGNKINDVSVLGIKKLSNLAKLSLAKNNLENIPSFQGLENLRQLDLSGNNIKTLSIGGLSLLPNLNLLDLTGNLLKKIEANSFPPSNNLTHLILNRNLISKIEENAFEHLGELLDLQLHNNDLRILMPGTFQNLTKLKKLNLNNNHLELNYKTFNGLFALKKLFLKSNNIRALPAGVFYTMQSIESIELDNNFITSLSREELFNISKLTHLSISNNSISYIHTDTWEFTPLLLILDLSHNNISEFKAQHLDGLENLERLNLGHNHIQYLMDNTFDRVKKLEDLNLRRNDLAWIIEDPKASPFKALSKLKKLNLYGNNIKQITNKSFIGLTNLDTLNLGGNSLATIDVNSFKNMNKLKKLIFKSINFICDCNLLWFKRWLNENFADKGQMHTKAICAYPEDLLDQEFTSLIDSEITCSKSPKPFLKKEPVDQMTVIGANVTFNCTAYSPAAASLAAADELKIIWRHDLHYSKPHSFYKLVQDKGSYLHANESYITTETQINHDQAKNHTIIRSFLRLFNVSHENAGKYQCIVSNAFGTTFSNEFLLSVKVLPKFIDTPSNVTVDTGDTVRLVCSTVGVHINQIVLQKSGDAGFPAALERRLRREENAFVISNAQPIDTGIYTCIANSDIGEIKLNTSLLVKDTPKPEIPLVRKETAVGDTTVLECLTDMASELENPKRDWFKDNKPFQASKTSTSGRYYYTQNLEILVIVNTSSIDAGQYYCEIIDSSKSYIIKTDLIVVKETVNKGVIFFGGFIVLIVCIIVGSLIVWCLHCYHKRKIVGVANGEIYEMENSNLNNLSASQHILSSSSINGGSGFLDQTQLTMLQRSYLRQDRNSRMRPRSLVEIDYKYIASFDDSLNKRRPNSRLAIGGNGQDFRGRCRGGSYTLQYIPSRFNQELDQQQDRLSSKDSGTGSDTAAKRSIEDLSLLMGNSSSPTLSVRKMTQTDKELTALEAGEPLTEEAVGHGEKVHLEYNEPQAELHPSANPND